MDDYLRTLLDAKARITEVAAEALDPNHRLTIDIREPHEYAIGILPDAVTIPAGQLATRIDSVAENLATPIALLCGRREISHGRGNARRRWVYRCCVAGWRY